MTYLIAPDDLCAFRRCRRQWDLSARGRRDLEPAGPLQAPDLGRAITEALDIWYFPGMWDWQRPVTTPLVLQALDRALARQRARCRGADEAAWQHCLASGRDLLGRYFAWSPGADRFAPVLVQAEYDVHVLDPARPARGLVTGDGDAIRYRGKIDMLAVDASDAYWIVRHRLVDGDWPPVQALIDDEELVTACWAWEQFYLGMTIAGTVHNEVRLGQPGARPAGPAERREPGLRRWLHTSRGERSPRVGQHEPSGGGRSIPQHRRMYAAASEPATLARVEQVVTGEFRRTWVRRSRADVAEAGRRLAAAAVQMIAPGVAARPSPGHEKCRACAFRPPCEAMRAGRALDAQALLRAGYRRRPPDTLEEGRLGGGAWGMGRGGAPRKFGS